MLEDNIRTFADNWTGTGAIENAGDTERLALEAGEYMIGEVVNTGTITVQLLLNVYSAGDTVTLSYRHAAAQEDVSTADWNVYSVPFVSLGFVQVRVASSL